jgi:hypothetical protein
MQRSRFAGKKLMLMLERRSAIPDRRMQCFDSPGWGAGVTRSWRQKFLEGDTDGTGIYDRFNFLQHLRFFIHGANLPQEIIGRMQKQVGNRYASENDLGALRKLAIELARNLGRDERDAENFMRLCADLGLKTRDADSIRRAIKTVKARV